MPFDSIYIKFKNRQNKSTLLKVRVVTTMGWGGTKRDHPRFLVMLCLNLGVGYISVDIMKIHQYDDSM